jgi:hypothetical protein
MDAAPLSAARHRVAVSFLSSCPACDVDQSTGRCPHDPSMVADVGVREVARHALDLWSALIASAAA